MVTYTGHPGRHAAAPVPFNTGLRDSLDRDGGYLPAPGLVAAVDAAMTLGQPILLNGEPGTGKSGLAAAVAWELGLGQVLRVNCKSDMRAVDLFYTFDHIRRLHDANIGAPSAPETYVSPQGLGAAILRAAGADALARPLRGKGAGRRLGELFPDLGLGAPQQSVVLIDEIDKASRDVPNDILTEIDAMRFDLPELGLSVEASRANKPFVVITSNSEKALPAPFLRRCVFYTIPFPALPGETAESSPGNPAYTLENIVAARLDGIRGSALLAEGLEIFARLREPGLFETRPSPAEFMNWLAYLRHVSKDPAFQLGKDRALTTRSLAILLKNDRDRQRGEEVLDAWFRDRRGPS
jgi:MoxR-like ATPase